MVGLSELTQTILTFVNTSLHASFYMFTNHYHFFWGGGLLVHSKEKVHGRTITCRGGGHSYFKVDIILV